jgi:hypothetical protein
MKRTLVLFLLMSVCSASWADPDDEYELRKNQARHKRQMDAGKCGRRLEAQDEYVVPPQPERAFFADDEVVDEEEVLLVDQEVVVVTQVPTEHLVIADQRIDQRVRHRRQKHRDRNRLRANRVRVERVRVDIVPNVEPVARAAAWLNAVAGCSEFYR